jgi:allophanate hydrolase
LSRAANGEQVRVAIVSAVQAVAGSLLKGFLREPAALADAQDITSFGAWRTYMASLTN